MLYKLIIALRTANHGRTPARRRRFATVITALIPAVLFCDPGLALELNSERIERRFGSYGLRVLKQQEQLRVSSLFSTAASDQICRTLAIVRYQPDMATAIADAHADILRGASIGATLREYGWQVEKTNRYLGEIAAPANAHRIDRLMRLRLPQNLALHIYDLDVSQGSHRYRYATIIEMHHPDYLAASQVRTIYRDLPFVALAAAELNALKTLAAAEMTQPGPL
jgi:hypothetical protein